MHYDFMCSNCEHEQGAIFSANDYDQKVMEDGRLKRVKCEKCKSLSLYRNIKSPPAALGGCKGYVSMERYQQQNPDNTKRKEASLEKRMAERHRKRVLDKIDKQLGGNKRQDRNKDYGEGQREERLDNDK